MLLHRRQLIASTAALALPGCTLERPRSAASRAPCLPRVQVSLDRVIRTVAGLRPYRPQGFVVRADRLGEKKIVHNYGHGGSGITLSWGTSRLAADLGLPGHNGPVAVIGAGIMGLTTARLVQEAGFPVTIYTKALPPHTTSNIAGGQWAPHGLYEDDAITPEWHEQFNRARDYSWRRFQIMTGDDYGIRWVTTYTQTDMDASQQWRGRQFMPNLHVVPRAEHPFPIDGQLVAFDTMYAETGRLLRKLEEDVRIAGGRVAIRDFATPADIQALPEALVFNCTGLGSRALFGDTNLVPVRGQLAILLPQPEIRYAFQGAMGYMFPRADGILLGGTFEKGVDVAEPQQADIDRILASHAAFNAGFRCA